MQAATVSMCVCVYIYCLHMFASVCCMGLVSLEHVANSWKAEIANCVFNLKHLIIALLPKPPERGRKNGHLSSNSASLILHINFSLKIILVKQC